MDSSFFKQNTLPDIPPNKNAIVLPEKIGPYPIESLLSRGGMSILYLGLHPETREPLAIKVLLPEYVTHPELVQRFLKESEIIALTNHPNIVKLFGQGQWEGGLYIAMELIRGVSLRQFITQQSFSLKRSLDIILQVAYALCHLHSHGVIHRDLKPENILITENGAIKVIDFGIAGLHEDIKAKEMASVKKIMGTPHYMSPEQKEDPLKVSFSSDIYSLGIITYELVLGKLSYGVINLSLLPKGLRQIVAKTLAVSVSERYQDIVDFITDISQYLKSGDWERDRPGTDQYKELLERLHTQASSLSPSIAPKWEPLEIGIAKLKTVGQLGLYYDFFKLPNDTYVIIIAFSTASQIEGALQIGILRGIVHTLFAIEEQKSPFAPLLPLSFLSNLNEIVVNHSLGLQFGFSFLLLDPRQDQLSFASLGLNALVHLKAGNSEPRLLTTSNPLLGTSNFNEFVEVTDNWNIGDILVITTLQNTLENDTSLDQTLITSLSANSSLSVQSQAETILKELSQYPALSLQKHPKAVISIQRID